jgi:hypothetical protein
VRLPRALVGLRAQGGEDLLATTQGLGGVHRSVEELHGAVAREVDAALSTGW